MKSTTTREDANMMKKLVDVMPGSRAMPIYEDLALNEAKSSTLLDWAREVTIDINEFLKPGGIADTVFTGGGEEEKDILRRELQRMEWLEEGLLETRERQCQSK
jgi:hypothetical protein